MSSSRHTGFSPTALQQAMPALQPQDTVWVGYSGGCDSHVLLHALAQLRHEMPFNLQAIYVNHGLSANAERWGVHCQAVCAALGVGIQLVRVDATPEAEESPEEAARSARYNAIIALLKEGDYLCTAHHQDDQAETLLLQLLRGAGPKGLAAMPVRSPLGKATQLRPLLNFSRARLQYYAEEQGLKWIEDESNSDTGFNRNFLRHEIMPRLRQRWPSADTTIARSAAVCAEAAQLLDQLAAQDYQEIKAPEAAEIEIDKLLELDNARIKNVLRYWIRLAGLPLPSEIKLQHVIHDVLHAAQDRMPCVQWPGAEVRRYQGRLYVMPPEADINTRLILVWDDPGQPLLLPDGSSLFLSPGGELAQQRLAAGRVTVRFRQGGEYLHPAGRSGGCTLKQFMQEAAVPPWRRNAVPLLYVDDVLAAVAGLCVDREFLAQDGEPGCSIGIKMNDV
jgi:tRNA(Ile)-lysidine synthase